MFSLKSSIKYLPLCLISQSIIFCSNKQNLHDQEVADITTRLARCIHESNLKCKTNEHGINICTLKPQKKWNGYPLVRVAHATLDIPLEKIVELWLDQENRKNWDENFCSKSEVQFSNELQTNLTHITGYSRYYYPPRDYVLRSRRMSGSYIDKDDRNYHVYVNIDASNYLPHSPGVVRGNMNSLLCLKKINSNSTEVKYIVEYAVNGWTLNILTENIADICVDTISQLKLRYNNPNSTSSTGVDMFWERSQEQIVQDKHKLFDEIKSKEVLQSILNTLIPKLDSIKELPIAERESKRAIEKKLIDDIEYIKKRIKELS